MVDIEFIRKKHVIEGWSIRRLSRQLHLSRQAIRKALSQTEPPRYGLKKPRACPVMDPFRDVVAGWLADDGHAPPKQRHTAKRVYDRLVEDYQFGGVEATVRRYVALLRAKAPEVFIPLEAAWGQQAQVDWGQATVRMAGIAVVAHLFCVRMRASGVAFAWAAPTEKLEAFLEGHCRAFAWLGGVPSECLYDNPKTAVVRILAGPAREEHALFSALRAHYLFDSLFCRPAQAHEKGAVENLVGYVRRNALVPVPEVPSWEALNAHLLAWCDRERSRRADRWDQERRRLRPLPAHVFCPAIVRLTTVNRLSLITLDHNRYSVPCAYVGQTVRLAIFSDRLEICHGESAVATHARCYQRGQTRMEIMHYLSAFARKPHAVSHAAVISQLPPIYAIVRDQLCGARPDGYRDFAALLLLHREFPAEDVVAALTEAHARACLHVSAVRQILLNRTAAIPIGPVSVPAPLAPIQIPPPDLRRYDTLRGEASA